MTLLGNTAAIYTLLVGLAVGALYLVIKLLIQPLRHRLRVLKHMTSDGAHEASLEERVRALQACLRMTSEITRARTVTTLVAGFLADAIKVLHADRIAIVRNREMWSGPGSAGESDAAAETALTNAIAELRRTNSLDQQLVIAERVPSRKGEAASWIVAARNRGEFSPTSRMALASLVPVSELALAAIDRLAKLEQERERVARSKELIRRASLSLERTKKLGLQGELAHHLVRELTGPMTGILGLTQFLERNYEGEFSEEIDVLLEETLRCRRILEQFATVSLADAGQESLEVVDAAQTLRELLETTRPKFQKDAVTLRSSIPDGSALLNTNPTTLGRLFTDLLLSGLSYAAAEHGEVCIELAQREGRVELDFAATRTGSTPAPLPEFRQPPGTGAGQLWNDVETIPLAVLETMSRGIGGEFAAHIDDALLRARLSLAGSRTAIPLHAGLLDPYGAETET